MSSLAQKQYQKYDFYDDKNHNYEKFWQNRQYEQQAEIVALKKLLKKDRYDYVVDLGGGYGRISQFLENYANKILLIDPSQKQLDKAKKYLHDYDNVDFSTLNDNNSMPVKDNTVDLLVMIRVTHHLIDPNDTFEDIVRVLKPGGKAIIEVANNSHFINRMRAIARLEKLPTRPVEVGDIANGKKDETPFVNHNPKTIIRHLNSAGLVLMDVLSVSNLRHHTVKKMFKVDQLIKIESALQRPLAPLYFGPSIFLLVKKPDTKPRSA